MLSRRLIISSKVLVLERLERRFYLICGRLPLSDFTDQVFSEQKRPEILRHNPKAKVTEVVKEIARCWSLMSKEDRMIYKVEAKRGKFFVRPAHNSGLTPQTRSGTNVN